MDAEKVARLEVIAAQKETSGLNLQQTITEFTAITDTTPDDFERIEVALEVLEEEFAEYAELERLHERLYLEVRGSSEEFQLDCLIFKRKLREVKTLVGKWKKKISKDEDDSQSFVSGRSNRNPEIPNRRRLPKLNLPTFSGENRDWIPFWSQFEEIHVDPAIPTVDKFQYLLQAMKEGTLAHKIIKEYTLSAKNYQPALDSLKERYGRESFLVKVYVRDLLELVIDNSKKESVDLSDLYVQLSAQLRVLKSLGVTTDKCAFILYPVFECCIPREILKAFYRDHSTKDDDDCEKQLQQLMDFLKKEVNSEDNIRLACGGLSTGKEIKQDRRDGNGKKNLFQKHTGGFTATAADLLSTSDSSKRSCVFCGGNHYSNTCSTACNLSTEDKKKKLKEKNFCFKCIRERQPGHQCKTNPQCLNCGGNHETVMCFKLVGAREPSENGNMEAKEDNANSNFTSDGGAVFLKTQMVTVQGKNNKCKLRAVIDEGSHKSYILKSVAQKLELKPICTQPVIHSLFGGKTTGVINHGVFDVQVSDANGQNVCQLQLSDSETISGTINCYKKGPWIVEARSKNICFSDVETFNGPVDILFGADVASKLLTGNMCKLDCGAIAVETTLGWTLLGEAITSKLQLDESKESMLTMNDLLVNNLHVADDNVDKLWRLDTLGIVDPVEKRGKAEIELETLKFFEDTVKINEESRVEVSLPWIEGHSRLPSYYWIAKKKLQMTSNKLIADNKLEEYNNLFKLWEEKGMIEVVPNADHELGHYLQHRAVYNPSSTTTPTRPVFNASYKVKGQPSLNECLRKGPNLLELIPALITRFRLNAIGILADITKAFQQISVDPQDRDCSRFLWWKDLSMDEVIVYRHKRVVFGVNASPFLLAATLRHIFKNVPVNLKTYGKLLDKSFYVDNLITSVSSMEEAEQVKDVANEVLSTYKMELRGWEIGPVDSQEDRTVSLLGLKWNIGEDTIRLDIPEIKSELDGIISRRKILSLCNSIFDPLGFLAPFILNFKILLQSTWSTDSSKKSWDDPVNHELQEKFVSLVSQTPELKNVKIPRWTTYLTIDRSCWSLHVFVDGSKLAYAACVYLRVENEEGVEVHLIQASSRVTPIKPMTIPRTELLSCLIGARLGKYVKECLEFEDIPTFYYTDSSTALYWITHEGDWGVFVQNRRKEILQSSSSEDWTHIPGECNPADLPSRGCTAKKLVESQWWKGPSWLYKPASAWPKSSVQELTEEVNVELRKTVLSAVNIEKHENIFYNQLCSLEDFDLMMEKVGGEFREAERKLLLLSQEVNFLGSRDKKLKKLEIMEDPADGMLRVKTRLFYADFDKEFRCPIVLPSKCPIVHALIKKVHVDNCHGRLHFLMAKLREKYWILKSRRTVRGVLYKCSSCRRFDAQPIQINSPPLPRERLEAKNPFEVTGIDLCGPMFLKNQEKVWIALFTCAVFRAVHLELVTSIDTKQFKMALRRFVSRRGKPTLIFTDNGTNFTGCSNELKTIDWNKIQASVPGQGIEWRFIPPASPWWGGWWERMVGIVKDLLRRVLGQSTLNQLELITILSDVEATVNERPLTYLSEDPSDLMPITPALFLIGNRSSTVPELDAVDGKNLNKRLRYLQQLREELRGRFQTEYLGQLANLKQVKDSPGLKVGDVVLVQCDNKKRMYWPMGKIVEMTPGRDGKVRVVRVQTNDGELKRPVQRIYPLEVPYEASLSNSNQPEIPRELTMLDLCSVSGA